MMEMHDVNDKEINGIENKKCQDKCESQMMKVD